MNVRLSFTTIVLLSIGFVRPGLLATVMVPSLNAKYGRPPCGGLAGRFEIPRSETIFFPSDARAYVLLKLAMENPARSSLISFGEMIQLCEAARFRTLIGFE